MPNPKKKLEEPTTDEPVEETAGKVPPKEAVCGHVNHQHYGLNGQLELLACDLQKQHVGDHHARYQKNTGERVEDEKGRLVKVEYHPEEADAYWNDAAGKPASNNLNETLQTNLWQKDLIMRILKEHKDMSAEDAYKLAKADPSWNAVSEPG